MFKPKETNIKGFNAAFWKGNHMKSPYFKGNLGWRHTIIWPDVWNTMKYVPTLIKQFLANVGKSCKNGPNMGPERKHLWKLLNIKIF